MQAARFATTVAGKDVRYALLIENGCASSDPARPCPAPVRGLTVTLNDDVVFQNDDAFTTGPQRDHAQPRRHPAQLARPRRQGGSRHRSPRPHHRHPPTRRQVKRPIVGLSEKPSNGLEPLTPSLPFWNQAGTRGHQRVTAVATVPQVEGSDEESDPRVDGRCSPPVAQPIHCFDNGRTGRSCCRWVHRPRHLSISARVRTRARAVRRVVGGGGGRLRRLRSGSAHRVCAGCVKRARLRS